MINHSFQLKSRTQRFISLINERVLVRHLTINKNKQNDFSFEHYFESLNTSNWQSIRDEYLAMDNLFSIQKRKVERLYEGVINDFQNDKSEMYRNGILPNKDCFIKDIHIGSGDFHRGKSTSIVQLNNCRVVYKPTNGLVSNRYFAFLDWLNTYLDLGDYRYSIVDKSRYHWQEFIEQKECNTEQEIATYYKRAGYSLCVLYLLNGVDFHAENIIANGDSPNLIDHETIIQPKITDKFERYFRKFDFGEKDTVLDHLLLPINKFREYFPIGMCGLGCSKQISTTSYRKVGINRFSKDWRLFEKLVKTDYIKKNIPELNGKSIFIEHYLNDFVAGFEECYKLFMSERKLLLSQKSPFKNFENVPVRFIWRSTKVYAKILKHMKLPGNLKNKEQYEEKIKKYLAIAYKNVPKDSSLWFIYKHEVDQMLREDIPYFEINTSSRNLNTEHGVMENIFKYSCIENLERKVKKLSLEDLKHQKNLIFDSVKNSIAS